MSMVGNKKKVRDVKFEYDFMTSYLSRAVARMQRTNKQTIDERKKNVFCFLLLLCDLFELIRL